MTMAENPMNLSDLLSVGRALAAVIALVGVACSLVGLVFLGIFYDPVKRSSKNSALAFFTGPLVFFLGDKDGRKEAVFRRGARILVPLLVVSSIVLVALTS